LMRSRSDLAELIAFQDGDSGPVLDSAEQERGEHNIPKFFGMDKRPFFPSVLITSLLWSMCMTSSQVAIMQDLFGSAVHWNLLFTLVYVTTIGSMVYTATANPGMMNDATFQEYQASGGSKPKRAHKHWFYKRPILRFHQYCKWVTNCVGLKNHRSYMTMLIGFVVLSVLDIFLDILHVLASLYQNDFGQFRDAFIVLHLAYSMYFAWYTIPLLRMHTGFVMRNELTQEWKQDDFQVVYARLTGEPIWVNDLDQEEYDELIDRAVYDARRNPWDKGWKHNCWVFWFTSRSDPQNVGEF